MTGRNRQFTRRLTVFARVPFLLILLGVLLIPERAGATCPNSEPTQNFFGSNFQQCPDASPVYGYLYARGQKTLVNSNGIDVVCESVGGFNGQGVQCQNEAGSSGDADVTVSFDWGNSGPVLGCPNPSGLPGVGRNVVQLMANDGSTALAETPRFGDPAKLAPAGSLLAPMPGLVLRVLAEPGTVVTAGQPLLVLEAMKMEQTVSAPADGVVAELRAKAGEQVSTGQVLAVLEAPPAKAEG